MLTTKPDSSSLSELGFSLSGEGLNVFFIFLLSRTESGLVRLLLKTGSGFDFSNISVSLIFFSIENTFFILNEKDLLKLLGPAFGPSGSGLRLLSRNLPSLSSLCQFS